MLTPLRRTSKSVTITNADGVDTTVTCPLVNVTDSNNPEFLIESRNESVSLNKGDNPILLDIEAQTFACSGDRVKITIGNESKGPDYYVVVPLPGTNKFVVTLDKPASCQVY